VLRGLGVVAGLAMVIGVLVLLLGPITSWAGGSVVHRLAGKDRADAVNQVRQTLLQAAAGSAALVVLVFTGLTFLLNRRGQVTDRYTKAIGLLASDKLDERIGGIYALEHIMLESERDHETVIQVLAAFVREHAPAPTTTTPPATSSHGRWIHPPTAADPPRPETGRLELATDIQTALTVLGRRPKRKESLSLDLSRSDLRGANLRLAHLEGANLYEARLENAELLGVHLKYATLIEARLHGANLQAANLQGANLHDAHLENAILFGADLHGALLYRVNLSGAHLAGASLDGVQLDGADLRGVTGLTTEQIASASVTDPSSTKLPVGWSFASHTDEDGGE
jgi:hypothetical protein